MKPSQTPRNYENHRRSQKKRKSGATRAGRAVVVITRRRKSRIAIARGTDAVDGRLDPIRRSRCVDRPCWTIVTVSPCGSSRATPRVDPQASAEAHPPRNAVDERFFSECLLQLVELDQLEGQRAAQKFIAIDLKRMPIESAVHVGDCDTVIAGGSAPHACSRARRGP